MRAVALRAAERCSDRVSRLGDTADRIIAMLHEWRRRARGRRELAGLDDRMLRDIGVTPGDAIREINKPFWRA